MSERLSLAFGFAFEDLYRQEGLERLDARFRAELKASEPELAARLGAARADPRALEAKAESELILALSPRLEAFLIELFGIGEAYRALVAEHNALDPLYVCKRLFVQRRAAKKYKPAEAEALNGAALERTLEGFLGAAVTEERFAAAVNRWSEDEGANAEKIEAALAFAAWATFSAEGRRRFGRGVLFQVPKKRDYEHLIALEREARDGVERMRLPAHELRRREGFTLTDPGADLVGTLDFANYCIWCHNQGKDSCSRGYRDKDGGFRANPFGEALVGCPLEEKISEMNFAKAHGQPIGALAIACVDNPLLAATGHHICNDCMKGCIYQKQEPVDIPRIESRTLKDVLALPWGVEIYGLLTRWNPLNFARPLPRPFSGKRALVVGLGPAGFNLAHHLLNDGHRVVAIEGSKIEPLPPALSGRTEDGRRVPFAPVKDVETFFDPLDARITGGFGGLSEYGITVRWNKNYLKLIRLLLERRERFQMFGGVRLGGALTVESAFETGFDHVALAVGAGHPTTLAIPNGLARGVRSASDFLMALQLSGAAKAESLANFQLRLPVIVIGGGLTAIDCATESLAYYPFQVEKFKRRYDALAAAKGEAAVRAEWNAEEAAIADEFLAHAKALEEERAAAKAEGRQPGIRELVQGWGGVVIAYRKRLLDSPMYRLNPEEVEFALQEGFEIIERLTPKEVVCDKHGHVEAMLFETPAGEGTAAVRLPARTVIVAAGTRPNVTAAREEPEMLALDGRYFQAVDEEGKAVKPEGLAKPGEPRIFAHVGRDKRSVSFFGDAHPSYVGNVVKAMAGAKQGFPRITALMAKTPQRLSAAEDAAFAERLESALRARVKEVRRLAPNAVELVIEAPAAARAFKPGQFFRLQNLETRVRRVGPSPAGFGPQGGDTALLMEGIALRGAWADAERGLVGLVVAEEGGSSQLCARLEPNEPVMLMGPTGRAMPIPRAETVLLAGEGWGNAQLPALGAAMRAGGCKVLYLAAFESAELAFRREAIESGADAVIWCTADGAPIEARRQEDVSFVGDPVAALASYGRGELGPPAVELPAVERLYAAGGAAMMAELARARSGALASLLKPDHVAVAALNSPMQCMMREICADCLQLERDPASGKERVVFACDDPDRPMDRVAFEGLAQRLRQNSVQEKLARQWVEHCLAQADLASPKASERSGRG